MPDANTRLPLPSGFISRMSARPVSTSTFDDGADGDVELRRVGVEHQRARPVAAAAGHGRDLLRRALDVLLARGVLPSDDAVGVADVEVAVRDGHAPRLVQALGEDVTLVHLAVVVRVVERRDRVGGHVGGEDFAVGTFDDVAQRLELALVGELIDLEAGRQVQLRACRPIDDLRRVGGAGAWRRQLVGDTRYFCSGGAPSGFACST